MPENKINYGEKIVDWDIEEYERHERGIGWYFLAGLINIVFVAYAFWSNNFLFAVIVIMASFVIIVHDSGEPNEFNFAITYDGLVVGKTFYDFDEIKNFAIVYKPNQGLKKIYFEFKTPLKNRLSIPLYDQDPLIIRENLLKYLVEDLERKDEPLSEIFARTFKI